MEKQEIKKTQSTQLPVSEQETQIQAPSLLEKIQAQKKKILIGLGSFLGVLILVGAVFGVYKYAQNQIPIARPEQGRGEPTEEPTPTLVATPIPDETADWETYTNEEYRYEIKVPKNWEVVEAASIEGIPTEPTWAGKILKDPELQKVTFLEQGDIFWQGDFQIRILPNSNKLTLEEWTKNYKRETPMGDSLIQDISNTAIGGKPAKRFSIFGFDREEIEVVAISEGNIYSLNFTGSNSNDPDVERHQKVYDLILSTFKFLPSTGHSTLRDEPSGSDSKSSGQGEKVYCQEPRPEVCTMECLINPPYICGSDGKSYCSTCQACAKPNIEWYVIQDEPCSSL